MRQLLPHPADIDPVAEHAAAARPAPPDRPWVALNMVASIDGATAVDGLSGALGGPADKLVFRAIRAVADVILVAAGTVRAEGYGPPRTAPELREARVARGQAPYPRLAIVSRSLDLDPAAPVFADAPEAPVVFTVRRAPAERAAPLRSVAELVEVGDEDVDLPGALAHLRGLGASTVACEGGPSLNGQLLAAGLIDEVNLTLSPDLVGGESGRLATGGAARRTPMALAHLWEGEDALLARYVRASGTGS